MRRVSSVLVFTFLFAQLFAVLVGWAFTVRIENGVMQGVVQNPSDLSNSIWFFAYIILAAFFILFIVRIYKGKLLFKLLEFFLLFSSLILFFSLFLNDLLVLILSAIIVSVNFAFPKARNYFILFATSVVGALLGSSLDFLPSALLGVLLAGYDYIAVFFTKHMVTMAKELDKRQAAFAVSLKSGKESIQLGTGDLVVPVILSVSSIKLSHGFPYIAFAGIIGSCAGLVFLTYILDKRKGYLPALPPIVLGSLLLQAIAWFIFK